MNQKILNSNMSIRWVVALKVEAEIILDEYNMNFDPEFTLFQVFRNFEKTRWLILSGIGRHNSAAATTYLYMISQASRSTSWINLGIAGSGKGHYGDLCAMIIAFFGIVIMVLQILIQQLCQKLLSTK